MSNDPHARPDSPPLSFSYDYLEPPKTLWATLLKLGPGMIIAGSIVGSGELIATTKVGAEAGFWLLWLIIIGCAIKVFAQIELGRYTMAWSETSLQALNDVPGPRWRVNWIVWFWVLVTLAVITQQGGIVGGIGQALAIRFPLTEDGRKYNQRQDAWVGEQVELGKLYKQHPALQATPINITRILDLRSKVQRAADTEGEIQKREVHRQQYNELLELRRATIGTPAAERFENLEDRVAELKNKVDEIGEPRDAYLWATILGVVTAVMLYVGRYGFIQAVSTAFVGVFTLVTIFTVVLLFRQADWAPTGAEIARGLSFQLPPTIEGSGVFPVRTALAAFGIIGVGATELVTYPYWCLEKGYAKHTGPNDESEGWAQRARGWMRVMRFDAWLSMIVYTFATIAFYLLGAAVLWRTGLNPGGKDLIRVLGEMYVPVFGDWASGVFLFGAFAVLYSTYFVAAAGNARVVADSFAIFKLTEDSTEARLRSTRVLSIVWPLLAVAMFWLFGWFLDGQSPAAMVLVAGIAGAIFLPMVGVAALWFRHRRCVEALVPGKVWTLMLWISVVGFFIAGTWSAYATVSSYLKAG